MTTDEFIIRYRDEDVRGLALQAAKFPDVDMPFALDQIAGWQIARRKLPSWAAVNGIVYPPHISMEQCSSEATARYKRTLSEEGRVKSEESYTFNEEGRVKSEESYTFNEEGRVKNEESYSIERRTKDKQMDSSLFPLHSSFIDLTGGFGVDFSFMSRGFSRAVYVERQPHLCEVARKNFALLGLDNTEVVCGDGVEYLQTIDHATLIYLDPARRDSHGGRTYAISDCTPDVLTLLPTLLSKADRVMVKLSPMLDWHETVRSLNAVCADCVAEVHIVSVRNECKELLIVMEKENQKELTIYCVDIESEEGRVKNEESYSLSEELRVKSEEGRVKNEESYSLSEELRVKSEELRVKNEESYTLPSSLSQQMDSSLFPLHSSLLTLHSSLLTLRSSLLTINSSLFLYEPNASIMKAGCFALLCERYGVKALGHNSHLFVSDEAVEGFPGRSFRITAVSSMNKKEIKKALSGIDSANIAVRNFPLSVAELRKRLKLKDGGDTYIFATTVADNKHLLFITHKI